MMVQMGRGERKNAIPCATQSAFFRVPRPVEALLRERAVPVDALREGSCVRGCDATLGNGLGAEGRCPKWASLVGGRAFSTLQARLESLLGQRGKAPPAQQFGGPSHSWMAPAVLRVRPGGCFALTPSLVSAPSAEDGGNGKQPRRGALAANGWNVALAMGAGAALLLACTTVRLCGNDKHDVRRFGSARRWSFILDARHEGSTAIDATLGNGHDAERGRALVGETGRCSTCKKRPWSARASAADRGLLSRASSSAPGTSAWRSCWPGADAIVFNLGWLPGAQHAVTHAWKRRSPPSRRRWNCSPPAAC